MLLGHSERFMMTNKKGVPFHEVIDIVRPHADREYLGTIKAEAERAKGTDNVLFLDRNNTPDIWNQIAEVIGPGNCSLLLKP
jgi:hypothetical protein